MVISIDSKWLTFNCCYGLEIGLGLGLGVG